MNTFNVSDRQSWRAWLAEHFETETEIWFVFPTKDTGEQSVSYNDAVEEALCFLLPEKAHGEEQAEIADVPAQIRHKRGHLGIGFRDQLVACPVILAQEIGEEEGEQEAESAPRRVDILKGTVKQPHNGTQQRYDTFKILS